MVIEWLKFRVAPEFREAFIQKDTDIWTTALASYPGFLGKMVWINPNDPTEIVLVIHWATREAWKVIPQADLDQVDQQFDQAIEFDYEWVESKEYQVRRFRSTG
ncbi:MAG: TIGR03792 family protein [Pseudanabaenales cyanobacterium]|nr:TIGR03792 family protein [Pseudanabaenales cyanobacterium]